MNTEIIASLIALSGVVVSVLISFFASQRQTSIEVDKLRREIHQDFSFKLFEKRLEYYMCLYEYLSDFKKTIEYIGVDQKAVINLFQKLQAWDSKYSIFLGSDSGRTLYYFRKKIFQFTRQSDQEIQDYFQDLQKVPQLMKHIEKLELLLKSELGIYAYSSPTDVREAKQFLSYEEVRKFFDN